jgi:pectate lyase
MKTIRGVTGFLLLALLRTTCVAAENAPSLPAFPGAEGFGASTPGGRGGKVLFVTTLEDSGPGSFRAACEADGPRTVIFRVSGTITLKKSITVTKPFLTIAGQTAPGDGICLRGHTFGVATHDVVVRYLRSRLGDESKVESDCIDVLHGADNVIIDHCSATWSVDECLSLAGRNANITVQWCLIGEALNQSIHGKGRHGYGSLARADGPVTFHHNLWLHNDARNPRMGDNYGRGEKFPTFDVRNNVIYDFGGTASGLTQGRLKVNYVANYIRPGPSSRAKTPISIGGPSDLQFFIRDNIYEGNDELTRDNSKFFSPVEIDGKRQVNTVEQPFGAPAITTVPAKDPVAHVLANVGASLPRRDAVDARLVEQVRTRTGKIINSQQEVGGWPNLQSSPAPVDSDHDGMPDDWETRRGLNPRDPADGAKVAQSGYTNLEEYLNGIGK